MQSEPRGIAKGKQPRPRQRRNDPLFQKPGIPEVRECLIKFRIRFEVEGAENLSCGRSPAGPPGHQ